MWPRVRWDNRNKIVYIGRLKKLRDREQRTGGGGSERQRAEERDPSLPAVIGVAEKLNRASVFSLKRRRFGFAPYRTRTWPVPKQYRKFFFLAENGYAGGTHAAVPRQYPYPRGTRYGYGGVFAVPVLPRARQQGGRWSISLLCFLVNCFPLVKVWFPWLSFFQFQFLWETQFCAFLFSVSVSLRNTIACFLVFVLRVTEISLTGISCCLVYQSHTFERHK